jgi:hypothetical protein
MQEVYCHQEIIELLQQRHNNDPLHNQNTETKDIDHTIPPAGDAPQDTISST